MSDHDLADWRLRARFEPLSHEDLLRFAEFSITAIRKGGGANDLTAFMDALIASRRQPAELYGRVLQSADLMRVIISHLALVDGGRAARTCKEWRTAWEWLTPTKSTFTEAEWYYGVPAELEGMVWVYDNIDYPVEAMARDVDKDGERLYFFSSKMWRLHATALQLKENQSEDYAYEHRDDDNSDSSPSDDSDEDDGEEADEAADEEEDGGGESEHGGFEEDD
eukprot:jgi/Chrpa1/14121/Chrysochromulina_OHIO_Genome00002583-RA